jgi:hypothetical protein
MKVLQGVMTPQQARERLAMMQSSLPHLFPEPSYVREFSTLIAQDQHQQQNGSGFGTLVGHPRGQASPQQSFV